MVFELILVFEKTEHNLFKCKTKRKLKLKKKSVKWNNNLCEYCPNTVSFRELSPIERFYLKIYRHNMW
jgi:hypothetical protein